MKNFFISFLIALFILLVRTSFSIILIKFFIGRIKIFQEKAFKKKRIGFFTYSLISVFVGYFEDIEKAFSDRVKKRKIGIKEILFFLGVFFILYNIKSFALKIITILLIYYLSKFFKTIYKSE